MSAVHCANCGVPVLRVQVKRRATCTSCQRIASAAQTAAKRIAQRVPRGCAICAAPIPDTRGGTRYCPTHRTEQYHKRRAEYQARRRTRANGGVYQMADGAYARAVCDDTLNAVGCRRRCPDCCQLYELVTLETPCPMCHSQLRDVPLTRTEAA